jgi:S1-C subfamily serine protease/pSer/pThr/pTyr-binding forkhead associated (FHA) protein
MLYMPRSGRPGRFRRALAAAGALAVAFFCAGPGEAFDVKKIEAGVFKIYTERKNGMGTGTGFLVNGRRILVTNFHVVVDGEKFYIGYRDGRDGRLVEARVIDRRSHIDLAVLEAYEDLPGRPLTLGDYEPEKLTNVVAIGFPGVADVMKPGAIHTRPELFAAMKEPSGFDSTITPGMVSRIYSATNTALTQTQVLNARTVQHNAPINPGNSGGPLVDECGAVVGVNSFSPKGAQGVFFSIHSAEVIRFLRELNIAYASVGKTCLMASLSGGGGLVLPIMIGMAVTLAIVAVVFAWRGGAAVGAVGQYMSRRLTGIRKRGEEDIADHRPAQRELPRHAPSPAALASTAAALALQPSGGGSPFALEVGKTVVVGRGRQCGIIINDETVSSSHARLEPDTKGSQVTVADLNSSNGTFLNGKRITNGVASVGDAVRFGSAEYKLVAGTVVGGKAGYSVAPGWMLSGFDTRGRALQFELRPQTANGQAVDGKSWTIGRDRNRAQFIIDDDSVSGAHAQITYEARQGLTLRDLGSTNGTKIDGAPLGSRAIALSDTGQEITFGAAKLRLSRLIR